MINLEDIKFQTDAFEVLRQDKDVRQVYSSEEFKLLLFGALSIFREAQDHLITLIEIENLSNPNGFKIEAFKQIHENQNATLARLNADFASLGISSELTDNFLSAENND